MSNEIELFRQQAHVMEKMDTKITKMEEQVNSMAIAVARVDERLKSIPVNTQQIKDLEDEVSEMNRTLSVQETKMKTNAGIIAVLVGSISSLIVGVLVKFIAG